jgi:peptidoglycan/LPS O-acetylase OafA/YrhL
MPVQAFQERALPKGRLASIDALRGIAVLAVMFRHLPFSIRGLSTEAARGSEIYPGPLVVALSRYGAYGVHLFLVISGFCIHLAWARRTELADADNQLAFLPFWRRRLTRLYPPYFVAVLGSLAALAGINLLLGPKYGGVAGLFGYASPWLLLADCLVLVLLLQNLTGASHRVGNGPFWSLALEEQLYMLYFPLLALRRRAGWGPALVLVAVVTVGWRLLGELVMPGSVRSSWMQVGPALWGCWVLGAIAVEVHYGRVKLPSWLSHPVVIAGAFAVAVASDLPFGGAAYKLVSAIVSDLAFGGASFLLVHGLVVREGWWQRQQSSAMSGLARAGARWLVRLGAVSYSVYLTHDLVFKVSKQLLVTLHLPPPLVLIGRFASGLLVGVLFYAWVERRWIVRARGTGESVALPQGAALRAARSGP